MNINCETWARNVTDRATALVHHTIFFARLGDGRRMSQTFNRGCLREPGLHMPKNDSQHLDSFQLRAATCSSSKEVQNFRSFFLLHWLRHPHRNFNLAVSRWRVAQNGSKWVNPNRRGSQVCGWQPCGRTIVLLLSWSTLVARRGQGGSDEQWRDSCWPVVPVRN